MRRETEVWRPRVGVVIPIRSFLFGKARLASALEVDARAELGQRLAERVVEAAAPYPVVVVTSAPEVVAWASARGCTVIDDPGSLDSAAEAGHAHLLGAEFDRVVVVHADLARARTLNRLTTDGDRPIVAVVPCHRDDGTNVLAIPASCSFRFSYGPGSFRRHLAEARRLGLGTRVVRDPDLAFDVDVPEDLAALGSALRA